MNNSLPCPLCGVQLDIRESIKNKPYVVCDPCGMQMFIRKDQGISALKDIVTSGSMPNPAAEKLQERIQSLEEQLSEAEELLEAAKHGQGELTKMRGILREKEQQVTKAQNRIRTLEQQKSELEKFNIRTCPECGEEFEIREDLIKTSWLNGSFQGFQCPKDGCKGIALHQKDN